MKAAGIDLDFFNSWEKTIFDVPANIKQAAFDAVNENFSHYSPVPGF